MIPEGEVGCKFCDKSIYRIFVEHIEEHILLKRCAVTDEDVRELRNWHKKHCGDTTVIDENEWYILDKILSLYDGV